MKHAVFGAAVFLFVVGAWLYSDERNRLMMARHSLSAGETLLGIQLNQSLESAAGALERRQFILTQLGQTYRDQETHCGPYELRAEDELYVYDDTTWRDGMICLVASRGQVVAMEVEYLLGLP